MTLLDAIKEGLPRRQCVKHGPGPVKLLRVHQKGCKARFSCRCTDEIVSVCHLCERDRYVDRAVREKRNRRRTRFVATGPLGVALVYERAARGLSYAAMALEVGLGESTLRRVELGMAVTQQTLDTLADYFEVE